MAIVKGIAYWACIQKPNTSFEPVWSIDLKVDSATAKVLKKQGLSTVKDTEDTFKFKRNVTNRKGADNQKPVVVDALMNPLTKLVGNGSLVKVQYSTYEWEYKRKKGVSADLKGVQVLKLVPYGVQDGDEFAEEEEFVEDFTDDGNESVDNRDNNFPQGDGDHNEDDVPF